MASGRSILLHMFGRPRGMLGWLGGMIMARVNRQHAAWAIGLLEVMPGDAALEIGFGPGVAVALLAEAGARVVGVDPSPEMLRQARRRNARALGDGRVDLRLGSAESLPLSDGSFDKALAVNSMQMWPDAVAGLREVRRVLRPGGSVALVFTRHSGQSREGVPELLDAAGFGACRVVETDQAFCLLAAVGAHHVGPGATAAE